MVVGLIIGFVGLAVGTLGVGVGGGCKIHGSWVEYLSSRKMTGFGWNIEAAWSFLTSRTGPHEGSPFALCPYATAGKSGWPSLSSFPSQSFAIRAWPECGS